MLNLAAKYKSLNRSPNPRNNSNKRGGGNKSGDSSRSNNSPHNSKENRINGAVTDKANLHNSSNKDLNLEGGSNKVGRHGVDPSSSLEELNPNNIDF